MSLRRKALEKFNERFNFAVSQAKQGGRSKEETSKLFLEAVLAAPSVWTKHRLTAFRYYIGGIENSPSKWDLRILKRDFLLNEKEPHLYRALAGTIIGKARVQQDGEVQEGVEYLQLALNLINSSPPEDDDRVVTFPPYKEDESTVKLQLNRMKAVVEAMIASYHGEYGHWHELHEKYPNMKATLTCPYQPVNAYEHLLASQTIPGGAYCDCCKKSKDELGMHDLLKCGRCGLVFYCSSSCQSKAWKDAHKKSCRKKGQIVIGDEMLVNGLTNRQDLNGRFVTVVGKGNSEGKWAVKFVDSARPVSISGDKLVRLRPKETWPTTLDHRLTQFYAGTG